MSCVGNRYFPPIAIELKVKKTLLPKGMKGDWLVGGGKVCLPCSNLHVLIAFADLHMSSLSMVTWFCQWTMIPDFTCKEDYGEVSICCFLLGCVATWSRRLRMSKILRHDALYVKCLRNSLRHLMATGWSINVWRDWLRQIQICVDPESWEELWSYVMFWSGPAKLYW